MSKPEAANTDRNKPADPPGTVPSADDEPSFQDANAAQDTHTAMTSEDEETIRKRLQELGYIE